MLRLIDKLSLAQQVAQIMVSLSFGETTNGVDIKPNAC